MRYICKFHINLQILQQKNDIEALGNVLTINLNCDGNMAFVHM